MARRSSGPLKSGRDSNQVLRKRRSSRGCGGGCGGALDRSSLHEWRVPSRIRSDLDIGKDLGVEVLLTRNRGCHTRGRAET